MIWISLYRFLEFLIFANLLLLVELVLLLLGILLVAVGNIILGVIRRLRVLLEIRLRRLNLLVLLNLNLDDLKHSEVIREEIKIDYY